MEWALQEIADWVHGTISGDPHLRIRGIASIEEAKAGEITFLANPKYAAKARQTRPSAILVRSKIEASCALALVGDRYCVFTEMLTRFLHSRRYPEGVDPRASIGQGVIL